ncbi:unnamed protein product [Brassicogethes aeneus]|uniref:tRNA pseudouridine synthase n=1 Tax=Brassicogethes aeneus TaxID=1431903 RepID=A0A9P0B647_BRAAE|nr:unnamed protein product [Brassicogethes aeneus]
MAMQRYLLYISYIGKPFRGAQRQVKAGTPRPDDPSTVQGRLEMGLKLLNPCNEPAIFLSSRTDSGVHALSSTCHVDLYRKSGLIYDPQTVTICLNKYFLKEDVPIRVLKTYLVPNDFHCRHKATLRTYLYKLILAQSDNYKKPSLFHCPIEELDRSLFHIGQNFNIEKMKEAAKLIEGHHDFRTFMSQHVGHADRETRRVLEKIEIQESCKFGYSNYSYPSFIEPCEYHFLNIHIQSRGFLYKQVRRTVATLVAVAQGKVSLRDIKYMLEVPAVSSWLPQIKLVEAHGLYLSEVRYSPEDVALFRESIS